MNTKPATLDNGKICYLEIPALDIAVSSSFYKSVFDWTIRQRSNGTIAFDDAVNEVSGTWVLGREVSNVTGILVYIMVNDITKSIAAIIANGGSIVQQVGMDAPEITARFADPAGNIFGLYQEPDPV